MPSQNAKGWSGILEGVDEPPVEERTDPHLEVDGLRLDEPEGPPPPALKIPPPKAEPPAPKRPLPRIPTPPTQIAAKPEVSLPRSTSGRLKLPAPPKPGPGAPAAPLKSEDGAPAFSSERLMDKLGDSDEAPPAKPPSAGSGRVWAEYKEVILSAVGGALLLLAVLAYQRLGKVEPMVIGDLEPPDPTKVVQAPEPTPVAPPPPPPPVEVAPAPIPEPAPKRAAVPMISLLSSPSGADVEINGEHQGKTPLIAPAPPNLAGMRVTIRLEGYKKWSGEVNPNEVGNYSLMARLEPAK